VYVVWLERDKKFNYSYNDASGKAEPGRAGSASERKQSAKKKKGNRLLID